MDCGQNRTKISRTVLIGDLKVRSLPHSMDTESCINVNTSKRILLQQGLCLTHSQLCSSWSRGFNYTKGIIRYLGIKNLGLLQISVESEHVFNRNVVPATAFSSSERIEIFLFSETPMLQCHSREWAHYLGINHWSFHFNLHWSYTVV